jgi:hypothetical protein
MKLQRSSASLVFAAALTLVFASTVFASGPGSPGCNELSINDWLIPNEPVRSTPDNDFEANDGIIEMRVVKTPTDGGIREEIPVKYKERFERWKEELLSTQTGRDQWNGYVNNKNFILTIVVAANKNKGAGTDKFLWDDSGKLVGATITLSAGIEEGYPNPIYYPVLNSLSTDASLFSISGRIVAATKLSHEIGHVNQASVANMKVLQLQNRLIPVYNSIFLGNGLNSRDKKLVELAEQMKGTPVEIWESREYWSEVNAMVYLNERISKEDFYCYVFKKIKRNIETYAKAYEGRFAQYTEVTSSPCWN